MIEYKSKPTFVRAIQWDESHETLKKSGARRMSCEGHEDSPDLCVKLRIDTYEGTRSVNPSDWIVEASGLFYVMSDVAFTCNYMPTEGE